MGRDFQYFFHARARASSSSGSEKDEYVHRSRSFECHTQEYEELNYISRRNSFIPSGTFNRAELKAEIEKLLKELDKNCEKSSEIFEAIGALGMVGKEFCSMYVTILYD